MDKKYTAKDIWEAYAEGYLAGEEVGSRYEASKSDDKRPVVDEVLSEINECLDVQFESAGEDAGMSKDDLKEVKEKYANTIKEASGCDRFFGSLGDNALPVGLMMLGM